MMTCIYCEDNECVESPQDSTLPSLSLDDIIFLSLSLTFQGFFFLSFFHFTGLEQLPCCDGNQSQPRCRLTLQLRVLFHRSLSI